MRIALLALATALVLPLTAYADDKPKRPLDMIVTFTIADYAAWRPVFDAAAPERAKVGVTNARVYRNADQQNDLLVVFSVAKEKDGREWMRSADVRAAWQQGGVVGTPTYQFSREPAQRQTLNRAAP